MLQNGLIENRRLKWPQKGENVRMMNPQTVAMQHLHCINPIPWQAEDQKMTIEGRNGAQGRSPRAALRPEVVI